MCLSTLTCHTLLLSQSKSVSTTPTHETNYLVRDTDSFIQNSNNHHPTKLSHLLPILHTEITNTHTQKNIKHYHTFYITRNIKKPQIKIIPIFTLNHLKQKKQSTLTKTNLTNFNHYLLSILQSHIIKDKNIYTYPILTKLPKALLTKKTL